MQSFLTVVVYECLDRKLCVTAILIDLEKAFDTVNHRLLTQKLYYTGIRGTPNKLIGNYLNGRMLRVKNGNFFSNFEQINIGIPQGSILGPLLFILYINDVVNASRSFDYTLYADDTTLLASHKLSDGLVDSVSSELSKIEDWTAGSRLSLNKKKTQLIDFSKRPNASSRNILFGN